MVVLNRVLVAYPLVAEFYLLITSLAHPAEKHVNHLRILIHILSFSTCLSKSLAACSSCREFSGCTAKNCSCKLISVQCKVISCDEGAHAVTIHEVWKIRIHVLNNLSKSELVLCHRMRAFISPVAPYIVNHCSLAVTDVIVSRYYKACLKECCNHVEISS